LVKTDNIHKKALLSLFNSNMTLITAILIRNNLVELTTTLGIEHELIIVINKKLKHL
jgi:hypothetical protein